MASEGKEAKVQEKQQQATHENKTKHNLARDTDVWKNPNSYKHLPSWLQQSSSSDRKRLRTNQYLPSLLAEKSKTAVMTKPMTRWLLRGMLVTHSRAGITFKSSGMWRRYQSTRRTIQNLHVPHFTCRKYPYPFCQVTLQTARYFKTSLNKLKMCLSNVLILATCKKNQIHT